MHRSIFQLSRKLSHLQLTKYLKMADYALRVVMAVATFHPSAPTKPATNGFLGCITPSIRMDDRSRLGVLVYRQRSYWVLCCQRLCTIWVFYVSPVS